MSENNLPNVYLDIGTAPASPVEAKVGQNLVLIRSNAAGGKFLHKLELPDSHFEVQQVPGHGLTPLPGQPRRTHIVGIGKALKPGSGSILVQFSPPHPAYPPDPPSTIPFVIS